MKKNLWPLVFGTVLTAFTAYVALDTFVLKETMIENATDANTSMFEDIDIGQNQAVDENNTDHGKSEHVTTEYNITSQADPETTETANPYRPINTDYMQYADKNTSITVAEYFEYGTHIYVADVRTSSAYYIQTAFAENTYGRNIKEKTSNIAERNDAVFAINGDYYGAQEEGYVIRNGIAYRKSNDKDDLMCLYANGSMKIINSNEMSAEELVADGVWQAWNFGPALVNDGEISVNERSEVSQHMASNPRSALGIIDDKHYIFVTSDGRTDESAGLSLLDLATFMKNYGAVCAYNLDGGGSATMYYDGKVINKPTTNGEIKERRLSDIVYIKKQQDD